jgi:hypothetical protein
MTNKDTMEELQADIEQVSRNYKREARGENKGELIA